MNINEWTPLFTPLPSCVHGAYVEWEMEWSTSQWLWPTLCVDPTLTINNLRRVTASVKKWHDLGKYRSGLGVPQAVRDKIRSNTTYKTEEEKKEALLLYYLHTVARASWQNVAGALHKLEEVTPLKAVNVFLQSTPAGEWIFQGDRYNLYVW